MQDKMKTVENTQGLAVFENAAFTIDRQLTEKPGNAHSYHYHDSYEIYYLFSGDRYYFIKDKTYHAKRGSLVLIKPYEIHCASNFSEEPYERMLISFKKSFLAELSSAFPSVNFFKSFEQGVHIIDVSFPERTFLESLLDSMLSEYKRDSDASKCFLKTALSELLTFSMKSGANHEAEELHQNTTHKTISLAAAYINNNYSEDISLNSVAERFFISPCYLSRSFKCVTGSSFAEYVNGVRIKEARRLLLKTDMSVSEVAIFVGFKSTTHFGRVFKSVVGVSPLSYRKCKKTKTGIGFIP
jgi:AraC-like DNA-binding protein/quercetin dioxygenase-like cupin family protein